MGYIQKALKKGFSEVYGLGWGSATIFFRKLAITADRLVFFCPFSLAHQRKMPGKKEGKKKENRQKEKRWKLQKEKKLKKRRPKDRIVPWEEMVENERKEKEKQKWPKDRIVPWEEMVQNERKEKEKEKERKGRPNLAALMEERLPPLPPRPLAYRQADGTKIRPFKGWNPRRHGATMVFFNTTVPLSTLCWPAHTARSWRPSR